MPEQNMTLAAALSALREEIPRTVEPSHQNPRTYFNLLSAISDLLPPLLNHLYPLFDHHDVIPTHEP